jgi:hypothetical protein
MLALPRVSCLGLGLQGPTQLRLVNHGRHDTILPAVDAGRGDDLTVTGTDRCPCEPGARDSAALLMAPDLAVGSGVGLLR